MARVDSRPIRQSSNAILSFSSFCITSLCLAFVIWKSSKCFSKFFNKPQVTTVSVQKAANFPFPSITICSVFGDLGEYQKFNTSYLEDVCGFRYYKFPFQCTSNFTCKDENCFWSVSWFFPQNEKYHLNSICQIIKAAKLASDASDTSAMALVVFLVSKYQIIKIY